MSAYGPKRTPLVAPHMSAIGCKADMGFCGITLSRSLLGVKRTSGIALHMSTFDPKRTSAIPHHRGMSRLICTCVPPRVARLFLDLGNPLEGACK